MQAIGQVIMLQIGISLGYQLVEIFYFKFSAYKLLVLTSAVFTVIIKLFRKYERIAMLEMDANRFFLPIRSKP